MYHAFINIEFFGDVDPYLYYVDVVVDTINLD
jgi:hypothetical protein